MSFRSSSASSIVTIPKIYLQEGKPKLSPSPRGDPFGKSKTRDPTRKKKLNSPIKHLEKRSPEKKNSPEKGAENTDKSKNTHDQDGDTERKGQEKAASKEVL